MHNFKRQVESNSLISGMLFGQPEKARPFPGQPLRAVPKTPSCRAISTQPRELIFAETSLKGCYEIIFPVHTDTRGSFAKPLHASSFQVRGLESEFAESFYSVSNSNVLRGMHFQLPPADQAKLVYCISGSVLDTVLDLRRDSPTFRCFVQVELSAVRHNALYLPRGTAHGFYVRNGPAVMMYHVTREYAPDLDSGVSWNSFNAPWPVEHPIVSTRDANLPSLSSFRSPF